MTIQELAELVVADRRNSWAKADPKLVAVATGGLNPDDEAAVRRIVADNGYSGAELDEMVRQVCDRVVGRMQALADTIPAQGGD